jgi:lysophospholipase L1-like esterase
MTMAPGTRQLAAKAALLLGSTLFSLGLLEIGLRLITPPSLFSPLVPLRPHFNTALVATGLPGVSPRGTFSTNRWGMRGDEPPRDWPNHYTILTIGGSTTQCFFLDDQKTWPHLLQERLRARHPEVWVGNGGLDGHTTRGHLLFMHEVVPKIRPNAVIFLTGINDLGFSINDTERAIAAANQVERTGWRYRLFASSRLLQVGAAWKRILVDKAMVVDAKRTRHHALVVQPMPSREQLPADLYSLLPALVDYRQNLRRLIAAARAMHVRPIFLTQPLEFSDTPYWQSVRIRFEWLRSTKQAYSCATLWRLLDVYNQELRQLCRAEGVECYDLAAEIPHRPEYFYDGVHFTERGAARVAEVVAPVIEKGMAATVTRRFGAP